MTRYTEMRGEISFGSVDGIVVLQTYSCSSFQSSPRASGCSDDPLRPSSERRSRFEPISLTISPSSMFLRGLRTTRGIVHHMLSSRHQSLIYDLRSIISSRIYMHTLLDHGIRPCAQCLSGLVPTWLYLCFGRLTVQCLC